MCGTRETVEQRIQFTTYLKDLPWIGAFAPNGISFINQYLAKYHRLRGWPYTPDVKEFFRLIAAWRP
jgi:hypothetical protein